MDINRALKAGNLARRITSLDSAIETLNKGYKDEWVLKNEHTGHSVELTTEFHEALVEMFKKEKEELEKELEKI